MDTLQELYEKNNFPSKRNLYIIQKDLNLGFTQKQVDNFVNKQEVYQLTTSQKRPKIFNSVLAPGVGHTFQIDLMDYDRYQIHHYKYILNVIDITSRYAFGIPLTNKGKDTIINAMKKIFDAMDIPVTLQMDNGSEFISHEFQDAMTKLGVKNLYYSEVGDIRKNSIVERFNRTLALLLQRHREGTGKKDWYKYLDQMYKIYNNTFHSTVKATPSDIWDGNAVNLQKVVYLDDNFKVGDLVRIKAYKKVLDKGDILKYSREVYKINKKIKNKYKLSDSNNNILDRSYIAHDLRIANEVFIPKVNSFEEKEATIKHIDNNKLIKSQGKEMVKLISSLVNKELISERRQKKPNKKYMD